MNRPTAALAQRRQDKGGLNECGGLMFILLKLMLICILLAAGFISWKFGYW